MSKRPTSPLQLVLMAIGATTVVACSVSAGVSASSGGGVFGVADAPAGPPPTGPVIGRPPDCPPEEPSDADECYTSGLICEYGSAPDPVCNVIARCDGVTWALTWPSCPLTCPVTFDERAPGTACGDALCTYLEATCGCAGAVGSVDDGGTGYGDDAGNEAGAKLGSWQCVRPASDCPARRPLAGGRCTKAVSCDYGACVFTGASPAMRAGLALECVDNTWTEVEVDCP